MVELKALTAMEDVHLAQGLNYLVAYRLERIVNKFRRKKFRSKTTEASKKTVRIWIDDLKGFWDLIQESE